MGQHKGEHSANFKVALAGLPTTCEGTLKKYKMAATEQ